MYMKNIFRIMLLLTTMLFVSCGDDDEVKLPDTKDVNYANIAGSWRLSEWNGENLEGDTRYYYITFDRKGKDGKRSVLSQLQSDCSTVLHLSKFPVLFF